MWLRLQFRILDSAWFFSEHLLLFMLGGGADFGALDQTFGYGVNILAQGHFWGQQCVPKKRYFATESFCGGLAGDLPRPN